MVFDYSFHSVQSSREIKTVVDFIAAQDLNYPGYKEWVQRAEAELFSGNKSAALAYSNGVLVGNVIWQPHKRLNRVGEIKNLRILPEARGRGLARFLLKQVECEGVQGVDAIVSDARASQRDVIDFFVENGYSILGDKSLYELDKKEVVVVKRIGNLDISDEVFFRNMKDSFGLN